MANPEIARMARRAVREVADSLRNRAHDLEVAFHGDNRRPCKKAATAMWDRWAGISTDTITSSLPQPIDACIADLVRRLNAEGDEPVTCGSCCGHGEGPGVISLADGRELTLQTAKVVSTEPAKEESDDG